MLFDSDLSAISPEVNERGSVFLSHDRGYVPLDSIGKAPQAWRSLDQHAHSGDSAPADRDPEIPEASPAGSPRFSALDVRDRVVVMLLFKQIVTIEDVSAAWHRWHAKTGGRTEEPLWRVLAGDEAFDRDKILAEAARAEGIQQLAVDIPAAVKFIEANMSLFSEEQWKRLFWQNLVPIERQDRSGRLVFVGPDPTHPNVPRLLREVGAGDYVLRFVTEAVLQRIKTALTTDIPEPEPEDLSVDESSESRPSVVPGGIRGKADRTLTHCLTDLVRRGATDLHLVYSGGRARAEMRIAGNALPWQYTAGPIERDVLKYLDSRIASSPIQDAGSPRRGTIVQVIDGERMTFDVSILPVAGSTGESESVVIRRAGSSQSGDDGDAISWPDPMREALAHAVQRRRGTIILAGQEAFDTTSGIEAVLRTLDAAGKRALTLDTAVSDRHPGVLPIRLNPQLGHAAAIDAIRNHDPDVVLAGELHTRAAAELAFRLANAGHLVVGTMTALDAADAVARLLAMSTDPMLPAYAMELVIAQRTARRICPECRVKTRHLDGEMLRRLGFSPREIAEGTFYEAATDASCTRCRGEGYSGRLAIVQAMPITREIRRTIALSDDAFHEDDLRAIAIREGMETLRASARALVARGETSISELIRVTAGDA